MTRTTHVAFAILALLPAAATATIQQEIATARDLESREVLFREQHIVRFDNGEPAERLVMYRCLDGQAFARKWVRYADTPSAPSFQLEDARSGYREGAEQTASGTRVRWTPPGGSEASGLLPSGPLVADAGFDEWVRGYWAPLTQGKTLEMRFLVPSRLRAYEFDVSPIDSGSPELQAFRLQLGGWFGWLLPSIRRDDAGEAPMQVRIDFPPKPTPADQTTLDTAAREALVGCTVQPA